jgi:hypothetical protein
MSYRKRKISSLLQGLLEGVIEEVLSVVLQTLEVSLKRPLNRLLRLEKTICHASKDLRPVVVFERQDPRQQHFAPIRGQMARLELLRCCAQL